MRMTEKQLRRLTEKQARRLTGARTAKKRPAAKRGPSKLEQQFANQVMLLCLPVPEREYRFHKTRRWRFDFAWPDLMLAVEIEGGTWINGKHVRPKGFEQDCEKYNEAAMGGWRVLRCTGGMVTSRVAVQATKRAIYEADSWNGIE